MGKTTTKTVRLVYDAEGRVKERVETTVTTEHPDPAPYPYVQPYRFWWQDQPTCRDSISWVTTDTNSQQYLHN